MIPLAQYARNQDRADRMKRLREERLRGFEALIKGLVILAFFWFAVRCV